MKRWIWRILGGIGGLIVLIGAVGVFYAARTGAFRSFPPATSACIERPLAAESAEDIVADRARGLIYISALDRRGGVGGPPKLGTVKVADLAAPGWAFSSVVDGAPADFRPHGLSLYVAPDGGQTLMAISHPPGAGHRIEIFDRTPEGRFAHAASVAGPELVKPNDLAASGPRSFFVVNDAGASNGFERVLENLFGVGYATLVHFDGAKLSVAVEGLAAPGGVNLSADGKRLFVAETQGQRVSIFDVDGAKATLNAVVGVGGLPDNIDIADDGSAWVTSHGSAVGLVGHFIDPANPAPSVIERITLDAGRWTATRVYASDGRNLSAGSVAVSVGERFLLGSITEYKILECKR